MLALGAAAALVVAAAGAPTAGAVTTCEHEFAGVLSVSMTEHRDSAHLYRAGDGEIRVIGQKTALICGGALASVTTIDTVLVVDLSDDPGTPARDDGATQLSIAEPGRLRPGKTAEGSGTSEIEFLVDMEGGRDELIVGGTLSAQKIVVGNEGAEWTGDGDADMVGMPFDDVFLYGAEAGDLLSGYGGPGAGAPLSTAREFRVDSGGGADLVGGSAIPGGDTLLGGVDNDVITGGAGNDLLADGEGDDILDGDTGSDTLDVIGSGQGVTVDLSQTALQDTGQGLDSVAEIENVDGTPYADRLTGTNGENLLDGGEGDDTLDGGGGADVLNGSAGTDAVSYAQAPAGVMVDLARTTQTADGDRFFAIEDVIGSAFADTLTGNLVANRIAGGDGADRVEVRDGEGDRVSCGAGADTAISDRRTLDALDPDCESVDALPEPAGPDGGPADPSTPDTSISVSLAGARTQRLLRQRAVRVRIGCPLEACTAVARGTGRIRAVSSSGLRATRVRIGPVTAGVPAGATRTVKLRLSRKQLAALRKALAAGQRPTVKVTVRARDAAGNTAERTLRVKARR